MASRPPSDSDRNPEDTSATLLDRLHAGDRGAAEAFARRYRPVIYAYASRRLQPADAEEVTQEVCVRRWQRPIQYDRKLQPGAFRAYLRACVHTAVNELFRKRAAEERRVVTKGVTDLPATPDIDLGELDEAHAQRALVAWALDLIRADFDPVNWAGFVRVRVNGENATLVANELGKKASTLQVAYNHIMKRLKEEVTRIEGGNFPLDSRNFSG